MSKFWVASALALYGNQTVGSGNDAHNLDDAEAASSYSKELADVSVEEMKELINEQAERYLGISREQFEKDYQAGLLKDKPVAHHLAMLIGLQVNE